MEDRKVRILKKALKLYGVDDKDQQHFIDDFEKLSKEDDEPTTENVEQTEKVEDTQKVEENQPIEEGKVESDIPPKETKPEPQIKQPNEVVEETPKVDAIDNKQQMEQLELKYKSLQAQLSSLQNSINNLTVEDDSEDYDNGERLGGKKIEPIKKNDDDFDGKDLEKKLGGN